VSHDLCPYVQRAAIALTEKQVPFDRRWINLAQKPEWFTKLSPTGKVPLLVIHQKGSPDSTIFESSAILEYLEETQPGPLHPINPIERARNRAWMEFGSAVLNGIGRLYNASDKSGLERESNTLHAMFEQLETELHEQWASAGTEPADGEAFFSGSRFSLVDVVFGPVFRYLDTFEADANLFLTEDLMGIEQWRRTLTSRPSVRDAIDGGYSDRLRNFLIKRGTEISKRIEN
jgi:glutathione S-transferase